MEKFLEDTPAESFEAPDGVVKVTACGLDTSSKVATTSAFSDYFIKGTEPKKCILNPTIATGSAYSN